MSDTNSLDTYYTHRRCEECIYYGGRCTVPHEGSFYCHALPESVKRNSRTPCRFFALARLEADHE